MNKNILIVESHDGVRRLLIDALTRHGYAVTAVASIQKAEELLPDWTFDVVLCDDHFIKGSGVDFLDKVSKAYPETHRILMSAGGNPGGHGAEFLGKPFALPSLKALVESAPQAVPQ